MKKLSAKSVLLYITYTALCLTTVGLFEGLLSFGLFVGAIYCVNPIVAALLYLLTSLLGGANILVHSAVRCVVMLAFWGLHKIIKRKINKGYLLIYQIVANIFYLSYQFTNYFVFFDKLLFVALGVAFAYICLYVFRAVFVRGIAYKLQLDEQICVSLFVIVASYSLSKLDVWNLSLLYFVAPFAILFCMSAFSHKSALVCSILVGMGNLLASGTTDCLAFCVLSALAAVCFCNINRYVSAVAVVLVDVLMSFFMDLHGQFSTVAFVPTVVSCFVFIVVPSSVYNYLMDTSGGCAEKYLGNSLSKKVGVYLSKQLYRLSDVFLSMKNAFLSLSMGQISAEQAQRTVAKECSQRVCKDCTLRNNCWRTNLAQTEKGMLNLAECAIVKGKCRILDVPQWLSVKCDRVSAIISEINSQAEQYNQYLQRAQTADSSKLLLGEQMGGVSSLLLKLATECKNRISYDHNKEQELAERLVFHNIMCVGATVARQGTMLTVSVTVARKDVDKDAICKITSALVKQNMMVEKVEQTESSTWVNVHMAAQPRYNVSFGVASVAKDGSVISGDTHTAIKTDNGKCIVALCDGMGSGERAEEMSATAISLVEGFYRAGFDNDTILSCVNKLLTSCGNEVFCAVDIVVLDMYNGLADFIKLGASIGLVKCGDTTQIVSGSSLPLGVLDEMSPAITKKALGQGDIVVLLSDGIVDCFNDTNRVAEVFVEYCNATPQSIAQAMLAKAMKNSKNKPTDDMTVVVAKLV